jgi:hypothetical protein
MEPVLPGEVVRVQAEALGGEQAREQAEEQAEWEARGPARAPGENVCVQAVELLLPIRRD